MKLAKIYKITGTNKLFFFTIRLTKFIQICLVQYVKRGKKCERKYKFQKQHNSKDKIVEKCVRQKMNCKRKMKMDKILKILSILLFYLVYT